MTDKELTPEQIREKQRGHARATLENVAFQGIIGSGEIMSNQALYGSLSVGGAKNAYGNAINGEDAQKVRERLYGEKRREAEKLGTFSTPSVSDYDVESNIRKQIDFAKATLSLGDLEELVQGITGDLDFEIPDKLKAYDFADIRNKIEAEAMKSEGRVDISKVLTEDEMAVYLAHEKLGKLYDRGVAVRTMKENYFTDLVAPLKEISEAYRSDEVALAA